MPKHQRDSRKSRRSAPYESGEIEDGEEPDRNRPNRKRGSKSGKPKGKNNHGSSIHIPCPTFDDMNLKPDLLKGVYAYGFEKPSAIQQRAIKPIVLGRDVIAQSQSGTGKTAVFSISSLQILDETSRDVQVLVLSPTRELAEQSQRVMQSLGDFMNVSIVTRNAWESIRADILKKMSIQSPNRVFLGFVGLHWLSSEWTWKKAFG